MRIVAEEAKSPRIPDLGGAIRLQHAAAAAKQFTAGKLRKLRKKCRGPRAGPCGTGSARPCPGTWRKNRRLGNVTKRNVSRKSATSAKPQRRRWYLVNQRSGGQPNLPPSFPYLFAPSRLAPLHGTPLLKTMPHSLGSASALGFLDGLAIAARRHWRSQWHTTGRRWLNPRRQTPPSTCPA